MVYALFLIACGVAFLALSGTADGLSPRYLIPPLAIIAAGRLLARGIIRIGRNWPKDDSGAKRREPIRWRGIAAESFLVLAVIGGSVMDSVLTAETKQWGDQLASAVLAFQMKHGRCPKAGDGILTQYRPALRRSKFRVSSDPQTGGCTIEFAAPAFYVCSRGVRPGDSASNDWYCRD